MGREARRARLTGPITNEGDLERVRQAGACALFHLKGDLRIGECYEVWCRGRDLPRLMSVPVSDVLPVQKEAAMETLITAVCRPPSEAEWTAVAQVLEAMGVPCWRWAASTFVQSIFPVTFYNAINPTRAQVLKLERAGLVQLPRGYIPREQGSAAIRRNVAWWYRAKVKTPKDPIAQLEREDAEAHHEVFRGGSKSGERSRSRVYDGLEQAENLLKRLLDDSEAV
jgi:hypothetical protein